MNLDAEERLYWVALHQIKGIGAITARNLMAYCNGAKAVFTKSKSVLMQVPGVGEKVANTIISQKNNAVQKAREEILYCQNNQIQILTYLDSDYPELLKTTANYPNLLFYRGQAVWQQKPTIAIVGTRKPSSYGIQQAKRFASELAMVGFHVISGLAYGIDAEVHAAALQQPGKTSAILGSGLAKIYPAKHFQLSEKIIQNGGAILTEYLHAQAPEATNFPARNRIIAGMSLATIVIEAASTGGALITAKMAFDENREVYAVPGNLTSVNSDGCNHLIRDNIAKLITKPDELIQDLEPRLKRYQKQTEKNSQLSIALSETESKILASLNDEEILDRLVEQTGLSVSTLMSELLNLEFKGLIKQLPGRRFLKL